MYSIAIKSEIDSRVIMYPLLKSLSKIGKVLLLTSNKPVTRLIDGEREGYMQGAHIIVDESGATDDILTDYGVVVSDYDFIIYDNVGFVEPNKLLIAIGPTVTEDFEEEIMLLGEERDVSVMRFGKVAKNSTTKLEETNKKQAEDLNYSPKDKFKPIKVSASVNLSKIKPSPFPSMDDIEELEANKRYYKLDDNTITVIHNIISGVYSIPLRDFKRLSANPDKFRNNLKSKEV